MWSDLPPLHLSPIKKSGQDLFSVAIQTESNIIEKKIAQKQGLQKMSATDLEERHNVLRQMVSECELLSEMVEEFDIEFQKFGHIVQTAQFTTNSLGDEILGETTKALPHSEFLINKKDYEEISMQVQ